MLFLQNTQKRFKKFNQCYTFSSYIPKLLLLCIIINSGRTIPNCILNLSPIWHFAVLLKASRTLCKFANTFFFSPFISCCCFLVFVFDKQSQLFSKIFEGGWSHLFEKGGGGRQFAICMNFIKFNQLSFFKFKQLYSTVRRLTMEVLEANRCCFGQ